MIKGPYMWTRNPLYVAVLSAILGEAMIFQTPALGLYALFLFGTFHLFIMLYEEPTLLQLFGGQYEEYQRQVSRWLRLWPRSRATTQ